MPAEVCPRGATRRGAEDNASQKTRPEEDDPETAEGGCAALEMDQAPLWQVGGFPVSPFGGEIVGCYDADVPARAYGGNRPGVYQCGINLHTHVAVWCSPCPRGTHCSGFDDAHGAVPADVGRR